MRSNTKFGPNPFSCFDAMGYKRTITNKQTPRQTIKISYSIYAYSLSGTWVGDCLFVCLSVHLYRINVITTEPSRPKFCLGPHIYDPWEGLWYLKLQKFVSTFFLLLFNLKTERICFCFYCTKRRCSQIDKGVYSESQIYEYIARVFYNVVFSTYLGSNAAEKLV